MIHYYTNREISKILDIKLAKWKRWSRSFLPPDPLGGLQSGYARKYTFKDMFKVYLGGHLLSHLKLSVVESREVIADLSPWMKKKGFLKPGGPNFQLVEDSATTDRYRIYLAPRPAHARKAKPGFRYLIRETMKTESTGFPEVRIVHKIYRETTIGGGEPEQVFLELMKDPHVFLLNLTALYSALVEKMKR